MKNNTQQPWPILLLLLLFTADFCFIILDILQYRGYADDARFSLGFERGYSEVYQYIKFFWIAAILSWFGLKKREALYYVVALLFFYFLFDDSLQIHERMGGFVVELLNIQEAFGLRGQDYGELIVS